MVFIFFLPETNARRPVSAPALPQGRLPPRLPRAGQLSHEPAQVMVGDADEGRMTQGRTSP